jgi:hypothetical protein
MCVTRQVERRPEVDVGDGLDGKPARAWAGRGKGTRCDHCHQPIEADQVEYEIELSANEHPRTVTVHLDCYEEWILLRHPRSDRFSAAADKIR